MNADDPEGPANRSTGAPNFETRLSEARRRHGLDRSPERVRKTADRRGLSAGLRIATEILAALVVGAGGGIVLDRWLGTSPWILIVGFVLGCAAAFTNVMRTAAELDRKAAAEREKNG